MSGQKQDFAWRGPVVCPHSHKGGLHPQVNPLTSQQKGTSNHKELSHAHTHDWFNKESDKEAEELQVTVECKCLNNEWLTFLFDHLSSFSLSSLYKKKRQQWVSGNQFPHPNYGCRKFIVPSVKFTIRYKVKQYNRATHKKLVTIYTSKYGHSNSNL